MSWQENCVKKRKTGGDSGPSAKYDLKTVSDTNSQTASCTVDTK